MRRLSGEEYRLLHDALLKAFPTPSDLRYMVRTQLDLDPESIMPEGDKKDMVRELLRWAEAADRMQDLIDGARAANPTNIELQEVVNAIMNTIGDKVVLRPAILFDQSHGQDKWVPKPPIIERFYKTAADSLKQNFVVDSYTERTKLSAETLEGYNVLVLGIAPGGRCQLTEDELDAIKAFVKKGNGLLVLGDYTGDWHHEANLNELLNDYGILLARNIVVPNTILCENITHEVTDDLNFDSPYKIDAVPATEKGNAETDVLCRVLLEGVNQIRTLTACSLNVAPEAAMTLLYAGQGARSCEPIPFGVTIKIQEWQGWDLKSLPLVAVCKFAKVVVAGSRKMFLNDFVEAEAFDNGQFFNNIIRWLAA